MEWIRRNKLAAAILGGLVVVGLVMVLRNDDPDSGSGFPISDLTEDATSTVAPAATPPAADDGSLQRPDVRTLKCATLLASPEINEALGGVGSWGATARAEDCVIDSDETTATLQIGPGHPNDFLPGAELFGVTGTPVTDVGDLALWFGGPDAEADGGVGAIVVAAESDLGALIFRIAVARPDLDSNEQLEIAKTLSLAALPRFPGIRLEVPEPVELPVTTIEHEPFDRSNESYEENLLAREADGDWTRGEGLLATLQFFTGEIEVDEVLLNGPVFDDWGTDIVRMAAAFLDAGGAEGEAEIVSEIERLLAMLYPTGPSDTNAAAPSALRGPVRPTAYLPAQTPECYVAFPATDDSCFVATPVEPALFGDKYVLWAPVVADGTNWEGWVIGDRTVADAMVKSAITFEGLRGDMPPVEIWLTPHAKRTARFSSGVCRLFLGGTLRDQVSVEPDLAQQVIASGMAACYTAANLTDGIYVREWWQKGLWHYLSDVVYPDASLELFEQLPTHLAASEPDTTLRERGTTNMAFFEYLDTVLGLQGTVDTASQISAAGLESVLEIDRHWHEYVKALTTGAIFDRGAGIHPYEPQTVEFSLTEAGSILAQPKAFGQERIHLTVDPGMHACIEYEDEGNLDMLASWRPGKPGAGGGWSSDLPATVSGDATFVITNTQPDGRFYLNVTDVSDDPDCEDEDEQPDEVPIPEPPCGGCPRSSFYSDWQITSSQRQDQ